MEVIKALFLSLITSLSPAIGFLIAKKTSEEVENGRKILLISKNISLIIWIFYSLKDSFNALIFLFIAALIRGSLTKKIKSLMLIQVIIFLLAIVSLIYS